MIELSGDSFLTNLSGSQDSLHKQIIKEREEKKNLEAQLMKLNELLASSQKPSETPDQSGFMAQYREMQLEIQAQKDREKKLLEEQKMREEEVLMVEGQY